MINRSQGNFSRRAFLGRTTAASAAAFAFPTIIPGSALGLARRPAPSNRIALAVIGTGNQGFNDIKSFLRDERVQIVAVCDVNRESAGYWDGKVGGRDPARRLVDEHYAGKGSSETHHACETTADFREILGRRISMPSKFVPPIIGTRSWLLKRARPGKTSIARNPYRSLSPKVGR